MHSTKTLPPHSWSVFWVILLSMSFVFLLPPPNFRLNPPAATPLSVSTARQRLELRPALLDLSLFKDIESEFLTQHVPKASWVTVKDGFSLPILPQPADNAVYVTNRLNMITQFSRPALNGVTALLAHNYRSGKEFYNLNIGQRITVTYDEDLSRDYLVVSINRFRKIEPSNIYSRLVDLETDKELSSTEVYNRFYSGTHHVTFQTCLEGEGRLDWGLYFVVADPVIP
jgi:hypothetical protein